MFNSREINQQVQEQHGDDQRESLSKLLNEQQILQNTEREPMFEKPLTPSDAGKLNRLVIPKQQAVNHFPLIVNEGKKDISLSFEDESGKCWRFRYSYWNSSQSYVLTKGWSRFVKEKRLQPGDVVVFQRHRVESDRFFIGWRLRATITEQDASRVAEPGMIAANSGPDGRSQQASYSARIDWLHAGTSAENQTEAAAAGDYKRLRLFGVDVRCQLPDGSEPSPPDDPASLSTQDQATPSLIE